MLCHTNATKKMTMTRQTLLGIFLGVFYCCLMMISGELGLLVIMVTTLEKRKEMEEREQKREKKRKKKALVIEISAPLILWF